MNRHKIRFLEVWTAALVFGAWGCTSQQIAIGPPAPKQESVAQIVILGTNDFHGAVFPMELKTKESDPAQSVEYQSGGATLMASYIHKLRSQYGQKMIWLDGGDEFQGTIESNTYFGAPMVDFFNRMGLSAAALGNHEWDFGQDLLKQRLHQAQYAYVASNVVDRHTGVLPADYEHTVTRKMFKAGTVNVGIIGLSTLETPTTTRPEFVQNLDFTELKEATVRQSNELKKEGAQVVVVVAHAGLMCDLGRGVRGYSLRRPTDPQGECGENDEIVRLLKSIPSGTVDAVVAGHTHQVIHHWVAGVPVIQGGARGHYLNLIHLKYDLAQKKLLKEDTLIEGPVPVCERVFEKQGDCNRDRPAVSGGRGSLVQNVFRGKSMKPDSELTDLFAGIKKDTAKIRGEVLGHAEKSIDPDRYRESALGNLVTDAMRAAVNADIAVTNPGGLRESLPSGEITFDHLFRTLPFDNSVWVIDVTGKELKLIFRVMESGWKGYFPASGVKLRLISADHDAPVSDLNHNGRIDPWEVDRLKEVRLADGTKLKDGKTYRLAIPDFLAMGGDQLGWVMKQIPKSRYHFDGAPLQRDAVKNWITKTKILNTAQNPLVIPGRPRVTFEKSATVRRRKSAKLKS